MDGVGAAPTARQFDVAGLRAQIREGEHLLQELDDFQQVWRRFTNQLREILQQCEKSRQSLWDPGVEEALRKADALRLDLAARQQTVLPDYRDPLATLLRTSLRSFSDPLWQLIGTHIVENGRTLVPIDDDGRELLEVSPKQLEITVAESESELARRRRYLETEIHRNRSSLEEAERLLREQPVATTPGSKLEVPATVTVRWALQHVPVSWWLILAGALVAAFAAGLRVGMIPQVAEIVGAVLGIETPVRPR